MRIAALIAITALLAGCQTPCPVANSAPVQVSYHCDDGSTLQVTYSRGPNRATVVQEGYTSVELGSRGGGGGFRFADRGAELEGRLSEVSWSRPGASTTTCHQVVQEGAGVSAPSAQRETAIRMCSF